MYELTDLCAWACKEYARVAPLIGESGGWKNFPCLLHVRIMVLHCYCKFNCLSWFSSGIPNFRAFHVQALNNDAGSGYGAPEVAMSGQYNIKSDVYSFGVVMLELLTGRKPFDR